MAGVAVEGLLAGADSISVLVGTSAAADVVCTLLLKATTVPEPRSPSWSIHSTRLSPLW